MRIRHLLRSGGTYLFLSVYAALSLFPIYFALVSSFKQDREIFTKPFAFPTHFSFANYKRAWELANVGVYFKNSVMLSVGSVLLLMIVCAMASYVLGRFTFKGQSALYLFIVIGLMIPIQSTMIPLAFDIGIFHLKDSMTALVLTNSAFGVSMSVFILTSFMKSIPTEVEESAIMDGCGAFRVFFRIIFPMALPGIATISIFNFLGAWNNLIFPLIFISDKKMMPIAYGLLSFFGERQSDYGALLAAIVITLVLPLLAYGLLQEKVERGLTAGAVKG